MRRYRLILYVVASLSLVWGCKRGGPTLPVPALPPGTSVQTRDVTLRVIAAQRGTPVAGARVQARFLDDRQDIAEGITGADGWVTLKNLPAADDPATPNRDETRIFLRIEAPGFLTRKVRLGDAQGAQHRIYPLWELMPAIGADRRVTFALNYGYLDGGDPDPDRYFLVKPIGDVYIEIRSPELNDVVDVIQRALDRVQAVFTEFRFSLGTAPGGDTLQVTMVVDDSICNKYAGYATWRWDGYGRIYQGEIQYCSRYVDKVELHIHEITHVLGVDHLPDDVLGIMNGPKWYRRDDYADFEKFALRPRNVRHPHNVIPDDALGVPDLFLGLRMIPAPVQGGRRSTVCRTVGGAGSATERGPEGRGVRLRPPGVPGRVRMGSAAGIG